MTIHPSCSFKRNLGKAIVLQHSKIAAVLVELDSKLNKVDSTWVGFLCVAQGVGLRY